VGLVDISFIQIQKKLDLNLIPLLHLYGILQ
jgi:hypothetical protein